MLDSIIALLSNASGHVDLRTSRVRYQLGIATHDASKTWYLLGGSPEERRDNDIGCDQLSTVYVKTGALHTDWSWLGAGRP